ncbi:MAG: hypothetical protein QOF00_3130 [Pseudonocardiales bacterium]|jgi:hypothetical protein|nr:hypothetical protein [Pseudonocardiales bacterium]
MPDPNEIRFDIPHPARVWNYWLGGKDNYAPDRAVGDAIVAQNPDILHIARQARQFLIRAVTFLAGEAGIDQFLDIGTGLPTMQNTHEVAQQVTPSSRIVYVDNDPLVLAYARTLLVNTAPEGATTYVHADVRDPEQIMARASDVLDLERPVAVMLLGVLGHATPDFGEMRSVIDRLMAAVPSGSYLVLQDGSDTSDSVRTSATMNNYTVRTLDQFRECFEGLEMVEPGLVPTPQWRPAPTDIGTTEPLDSYCAVGRKP